MTDIALGWALVSAVGVLVLYTASRFVAEGWQDENGFHYGKPEDEED